MRADVLAAVGALGARVAPRGAGLAGWLTRHLGSPGTLLLFRLTPGLAPACFRRFARGAAADHARVNTRARCPGIEQCYQLFDRSPSVQLTNVDEYLLAVELAETMCHLAL